MTHLCTTILEFSDRLEGQILAVGTEEECEHLRDMVPAIIVKGEDETPENAHVAIMPQGDLFPGGVGVEVGRCWFYDRDA